MPSILQGVQNAGTANIASSVTNPEALSQAKQSLAILQLLGLMNLGQFGSLVTLTSLAQVQQTVLGIKPADLVTIVDALQEHGLVYSTIADGLLSNTIALIEMVEDVAPLVSDIKPVVSYIILEQLGLTGLQDLPSRVGDAALASATGLF
jgi:hypothetical protein